MNIYKWCQIKGVNAVMILVVKGLAKYEREMPIETHKDVKEILKKLVVDVESARMRYVERLGNLFDE